MRKRSTVAKRPTDRMFPHRYRVLDSAEVVLCQDHFDQMMPTTREQTVDLGRVDEPCEVCEHTPAVV